MRIVRLIYPNKGKISISSIKISGDHTIYGTVDVFKQNIPQDKSIEEIKEKILLKDIINLHNDTGIQSIDRIKSMIKAIREGKDILSDKKIPNIKLIKTKDNKHVLFDGHHSMLAYMFCGKQYLHEIPHIIVENEDKCITDEEIKVFFGDHANKADWKEHTINWQQEKEKQLCKRIHKNMGEVIHSISKALQ
jgi:hypothetical protein